jgi:hypothetical protein
MKGQHDMPAISEIVNVLLDYGIVPDKDVDLPGIGKIEEDETVYSTSVQEILGEK